MQWDLGTRGSGTLKKLKMVPSHFSLELQNGGGVRIEGDLSNIQPQGSLPYPPESTCEPRPMPGRCLGAPATISPQTTFLESDQGCLAQEGAHLITISHHHSR